MSELIGVSELIGIAQASGKIRDGSFKAAVVGAVGMAAASGKTSFVLGVELHRLRCAGQPDRWYATQAMFRKRVRVLAKRGRWRKVNETLLDKLCEYTLREWLFDICVPCQGRSKIAIELYTPDGTRVERVCDACGGTGKGKPSVTVRVEALGIPVEEYMKVWGGRFEEVRAVLDKAYGVAQRAVARRLGRRVDDA